MGNICMADLIITGIDDIDKGGKIPTVNAFNDLLRAASNDKIRIL